jgi:transporter family-2 protein
VTTKILFALLAVVAGVATALQATANAGLAQRVGLGAALVVNTSIVLAGALAFFTAQGVHANFFPAGTSWALYIGGVCGFVVILCLAFVFPRIGAVWAIALVVLGQSVAALAIDHYGLLGMPKDPITIQRAGGLALIVLGVSLSRV